jgi:hypothetical protein
MRCHILPARTGSFIELLESRQLLSAAPLQSAVAVAPLLVVGPISAPTGASVTLHERAGVPFTASLGTFVTIAPAKNLEAAINWGDGTASKGTLVPDGVVGLDELKFEVDGTHTYRKAGTFRIKVIVTQPGPTPTSPVRLVATIRDRAIVVAAKPTLLDGTIHGTYSLAPTAADIGAGYVFNGTGTAGDLGAVSAHAFVTLPGFIATGQATGTLTLTQVGPSASAVNNSVTLKLTGPTEAGFGAFPASLAYVITGGTGAFAGATGIGSIAVTLNSDMTFSFVITSALPPVV